ncbi:hypothetical protein Tco_1328017 [Tanacetum coccineum]
MSWFSRCSWCGGPFNGGNCRRCTNVSFEDELVRNPDPISKDETPDFSYSLSQPQTSSFDQFHCFGCGDPLEDGVCCQRCTYKWCGNNLRNGFCSICDSGAGNSFIYGPNPNSFNDPPNFFNHPLQPLFKSYSLCGNDSHYGYDCPPRVSLVYEQESCYNQNFGDNYYPQNSLSFPQQFLCCENYRGPHENFQCQPRNQNYFESNPCYNPNSYGFYQPIQTSINHQPPKEMSIRELLLQEKLHKALQAVCEKLNQQEQAANVSTHTPEPSRRFNIIVDTKVGRSLIRSELGQVGDTCSSSGRRVSNNLPYIRDRLQFTVIATVKKITSTTIDKASINHQKSDTGNTRVRIQTLASQIMVLQLTDFTSEITDEELLEFTSEYYIPFALHPVVPAASASIADFPEGKVGVYTRFFEFANQRVPLSLFMCNVLNYYRLHISQMHCIGAAKITNFEVNCRLLAINPTVHLFRAFYHTSWSNGWVSFSKRAGRLQCYTEKLDALRRWREMFFWVDDALVPWDFAFYTQGSLPRDERPPPGSYSMEDAELINENRIPINAYSEAFLCHMGISHNYFQSPEEVPTFIGDDGQEMDLFSVVHLSKPKLVTEGVRPLRDGEEPLLESTKTQLVCQNCAIYIHGTEEEAAMLNLNG